MRVLRPIVVVLASLLVLALAAPAAAQSRSRGKTVKRGTSKRAGPKRARIKVPRLNQAKQKSRRVKPPGKNKVPARTMRRNVGVLAAQRVRSGQVVGLGTGRTANEVIRALGKRVKQEGLKITGVATSKRTAELARKHGIPLVDPSKVAQVDVAIDGADEVDPSLDLVKGLGGALLREKQVARKAREFIIVVDEGKMVSSLGRGKIPVEVVPKGSDRTRTWLRLVGGSGGVADIRTGETGKPYVTDNGNYIVDLSLGARPRGLLGSRKGRQELAQKIERVRGVVDHGLFLGMTSEVLVGRTDGSVQEIGGK